MPLVGILLSASDTAPLKSVVPSFVAGESAMEPEMEGFLADFGRFVARRWSGKVGQLTKTGLQRLGVVVLLHPLWQEHRGRAVWPASKIRK